jgi:hypothetical protein
MTTTKAKQAKQLLNKIAPKGEKLAYINPKEANLLKSVGGSGNITPQGIPSFEWTGGATSSATSDSSYGDYSSSDDSSSSDNTPVYVDAVNDPGNARNAPDPSLGDPDPGGTWQIDEKTNTIKFVESTDTITSYSDNLKAQIKADPLISALSPLGTLGKVGIQTLAANYMLGNIKNPIGSWKSPANDYYNPPEQSQGDNNDNQVSATTQTPTQDLTPQVTQQSPAADYYANIGSTTNNQSSFQSDLDAARITQKGLLSTPSSIGLLAINESPFYDFLKQNKLDRRVL